MYIPGGIVQRRATDCATPVLRELAASGTLRQAACAPEDAALLRGAAFELALPLVWDRHTRPLEAGKGHRRCASGLPRLAPDCADRFTDDLESVVTALLAYRRPIGNIEGWITVRMANAIKDGHRVRRAREMGAQQRVRVPSRVAALLGDDPWLVALADRVLTWAGVRHTAGTGLWPLGVWAEDRARLRGTHGSGTSVADDLETVLRAMRQCDPAWYDKYVERPLGRKWAPVASWATDEAAGAAPRDDAAYLPMVPAHERNDSRLAESAATSLALLRNRLAAGAAPRRAVRDALAEGFLSVGALCGELDRAPDGHDPADRIAAILADEGALDRLVPEVLAIIG